MVTSVASVMRRSVPARRRFPVLQDAVRRLVDNPAVRGMSFLVLGVLILVVIVARKEGGNLLPPSTYAPAVVVAGLYLRPRWMALVCVTFCAELFVATLVLVNRNPQLSTWVALAANVAVILLSYGASISRSRIGVEGHRGESMFVDLRDRLRAFGEIPALPDGWHAESAVESAYGQSFSGDFVVATKGRRPTLLEVALVDVSGKGVQAGTRSLLLSGALGGLLGETEPERFLGAANSYLVRQEWDEGFATAVHVSVDLTTGDYDIGTAGHPSGVHFHSGSGRWAVLEQTTGPVLGVVEGADYSRTSGVLGRGDALVLYTDGVIETRSRDLTVGVDRMLGIAERLVTRGFHGGAARLCASARAGETDDRAVVMIWRD